MVSSTLDKHEAGNQNSAHNASEIRVQVKRIRYVNE